MMQYKYDITPKAVARIIEFYAHVVLKYQHTFSFDDMNKCISLAVFNAEKIEKSIIRRKPTLARWKSLYMAKVDKWYYAYTIEGDTVTVHDACHQQNMHEDMPSVNDEDNEEW